MDRFSRGDRNFCQEIGQKAIDISNISNIRDHFKISLFDLPQVLVIIQVKIISRELIFVIA